MKKLAYQRLKKIIFEPRAFLGTNMAHQHLPSQQRKPLSKDLNSSNRSVCESLTENFAALVFVATDNYREQSASLTSLTWSWVAEERNALKSNLLIFEHLVGGQNSKFPPRRRNIDSLQLLIKIVWEKKYFWTLSFVFFEEFYRWMTFPWTQSRRHLALLLRFWTVTIALTDL